MADKKDKKKSNFISTVLEILLLLGFLSLEYGLFIVYEPSAFIIGGILLMCVGYPKTIKPQKRQD